MENKQNSRIIKKRVENDTIKPYKSMRSINFKNNLIKNINEEEREDMEYNKRIDIIDQMIIGFLESINKIKNSLFKTNSKIMEIFIVINKIKKKINEKGNKLYEYIVSWKISN